MANTTGELFLAFNADSYGDNSGGWASDITIQSASIPASSTLALALLGVAGFFARKYCSPSVRR